MTEKRNRFPGAKPFTAADKQVFYGRQNDIQKLFELLGLKRILVLYAESGIGKSSLVNAGLVPMCQMSKSCLQFYVIKVRFGLALAEKDDHTPVDYLVQRVIEELTLNEDLVKSQEFPIKEPTIENTLWYHVKLFEKNGIRLLLAFDQFEELFSYRADQINYFKKQIFSLFATVPADLNNLILQQVQLLEEKALDQDALLRFEEDLKFIYNPLNTQLLYIIREDKLGYFNSFTDYFADILKDTYKLLPLNRASAADAIAKPAAEEGDFFSKPFEFTPAALEKLLNRLAEKNETYDPFTIQLTCRYIEKKLVIEEGKHIIEEDDIPEVSIIVRDFIDSAWKALPLPLQKNTDHYKQAIETKLIAQDIEKRISVHEAQWIENAVVAVLINEGLLKRDRRGGVDYIELSHDRLIKPLLEDFRERRRVAYLNKKRKKVAMFSFPVLLVVLIGIFFLIRSHILETDFLVKRADSLMSDKNILKGILANKSNQIETFEKKENSNSAEIYALKAKQLVQNRDYTAADNYYAKALVASFKADNFSKVRKIDKSKIGIHTPVGTG